MLSIEGLDCRYQRGDLRCVRFEGTHDLALLLFGEINSFTPEEVASLLARTRCALRSGLHA